MIDEKTRQLLTAELKQDSCGVFETIVRTAILHGNADNIVSQSIVFNAPHVLNKVLPHINYSPEKYQQALHSAVIHDNIPCVEVLWKRAAPSAQQQYNLLKQSMLHKKVNMAQHLLDKGVDPNDKDQTLLALCVCQRQETLVEKLLEKCDHKASLDCLRNEYMHCYDSWQWFDDMMNARDQRAILEAAMPATTILSVRKI